MLAVDHKCIYWLDAAAPGSGALAQGSCIEVREPISVAHECERGPRRWHPACATLARIMRNNISSLAIVTAALLSAPVHAEILYDRDNGPLTGLFGFPDSTEGGKLVGRGKIRVDTIANAASHAIVDLDGNEALVLDGETRRLELNVRYGVSERLEVGIQLPYLWHESGSLDSLIDSWHSAFGLPDGFRDDLPIDDLNFRYIDRSVERIDLDQNANGLGDLRLIGGLKLYATDTRRIALRIGLKLPTGDSANLLGSGGTDLSVGIAGQFDEWLGQPRLNAYFTASGVKLGEPDFLADRVRSLVGHAAFGVGYAAWDRLELRAQAAIRTAAYDSDIENLGDGAALLTVGGNIRLASGWLLSLAVAEDIKVGSTPDVAFQIGLHYRPPPGRPLKN